RPWRRPGSWTPRRGAPSIARTPWRSSRASRAPTAAEVPDGARGARRPGRGPGLDRGRLGDDRDRLAHAAEPRPPPAPGGRDPHAGAPVRRLRRRVLEAGDRRPPALAGAARDRDPGLRPPGPDPPDVLRVRARRRRASGAAHLGAV